MAQESTSRSALTVSRIVAAARRLADQEGLAELTLRRVARELGTGQSSLYRHIADRHELLGHLVDDLAGGYPLVGDTTAEPVDQVRAQWSAIDHYLDEHPWFVALVAEGRFQTKAALPMADHCLAQLRALGLDDRDALCAYRTLWHLIIGQHMSEHPFGLWHDGAAAEAAGTENELLWTIDVLARGMAAAAG